MTDDQVVRNRKKTAA